jgi:hypothetical protein
MSRWRSHEEDAQPNSGLPPRVEVPQPEERELSRAGSEDDQNRQPQAQPIDVPVPEPRKPYRDRGRTYLLHDAAATE